MKIFLFLLLIFVSLPSCVVSTTKDDKGSVTYKIEILDFGGQTDNRKIEKTSTDRESVTKTSMVLKAVVTKLTNK